MIRSNVALNSDNTLDGLDRRQVHTYDFGTNRHGLHSDLGPTARRAAQVYERTRRAQEVELLRKLDQLKRRTRTITLLLSQVVETVETTLSSLLLVSTHSFRDAHKQERLDYAYKN